MTISKKPNRVPSLQPMSSTLASSFFIIDMAVIALINGSPYFVMMQETARVFPHLFNILWRSSLATDAITCTEVRVSSVRAHSVSIGQPLASLLPFAMTERKDSLEQNTNLD